MNLRTSLLTLSAGIGLSVNAGTNRPNVIVILVDDMGFSDIGCYGSEIPTPNIDQLAAQGIRFSHFRNTSRSCPSRASLLTGLYQHQTGVGMMTSENGTNFDFGVSGYRGYLNKNCVTIAEVLKQSGYHTYMTGKWHLGSDTLYKRPLQRGFEHFYGSYQGAFSYFNPTGNRCLINETDTIQAPEGFYSTDAFTSKAIEYISGQKDKRPFFLYLAYNAPHWPLQAKEADVELFRGKYLVGWDSLRTARYNRQLAMGIIPPNSMLSPRDKRVRPWTEVTEKQRIESDYRMAVYAAQIHTIDQNVGKLIQYLKQSGKMDNTLILFLSDNGACAEPYKEFGGGNVAEINDPNQSGSVSYGIGWANLSNTPFRSYKTNAYEGGVATPFIAVWPAQLKEKGKITPFPGHVLNIMPTILEATGAKYPKVKDGYKILAAEGQSLLPVLLNKKTTPPAYQYWEHSYNCAVTKGPWKAVSRIGTNNWALYNLEEDPTELNNKAGEYPDVLVDLVEHWKLWAERCKVLPKGTRTKNSYD